jgi:hypothetical protein
VAGGWNHRAAPKIRGGQSPRAAGPCGPIAVVLDPRLHLSRSLIASARSAEMLKPCSAARKGSGAQEPETLVRCPFALLRGLWLFLPALLSLTALFQLPSLTFPPGPTLCSSPRDSASGPPPSIQLSRRTTARAATATHCTLLHMRARPQTLAASTPLTPRFVPFVVSIGLAMPYQVPKQLRAPLAPLADRQFDRG